MNRKLVFRIILVIVIGGAVYRLYVNQPEFSMTHITGQTMGTIQYNVKYLGADAPDFKTEIDSILLVLNQSLSTYIADSEISVLNATGTLNNPSQMFLEVLNRSKAIYEATDGAFDPTVGPLVSAWGFGADKKVDVPDSLRIAELLISVGLHKVLSSNQIVTMDTSMYLDFSAIAKGHAVDLVGEFLEEKGFENYLVEIGGEVRAKGENEENEKWKIGIEDPLVEVTERKLLAIVQLKDRSMATSGNYRNYYKIGDQIIAHTIDPRTGFNTTHNLLSASVFANDCMTADAYATAFMVLGVQASIELVEDSDMDAFLIYRGEDNEVKSYASGNLKPFLDLNKIK